MIDPLEEIFYTIFSALLFLGIIYIFDSSLGILGTLFMFIISAFLFAGVYVLLKEFLGKFLRSIKNQRMKNKDDKIKHDIYSVTDVNTINDGEFVNLCQYGTLEEIKHAINSGANINAFGEYNRQSAFLDTYNRKSALMYAVERDKPDMITLLLDAGADVNAVDSFGRPALMFAIEKDNPDVISLLLEAGADVNAVDKNGKSALMYAIERDKLDMIMTIPFFERHKTA